MDTKEAFYKACRVSAIIGTIQAAYTDMPYLGTVTEQIARRDSLIGVGITGMAENPHILFDESVQVHGANIVKETNIEMAKFLGINPAARCTVIKPSGNAAAMTGTSSGIHPFHSKRYIRNVQVNKNEQAGKLIAENNNTQVRDSIYNPSGDWVISFPVELDGDIIVKDDLSAIEFLELVKKTQSNWIEHGTNFDHPSYHENPNLRHNVSNTCTIPEGEWDSVKDYLWLNRDSFCGVSMLSASGDLDYPQAPFTGVLDEVELANKYGAAAMLAGGLNVDGLHAFGDLWVAIDSALGKGVGLVLTPESVAEKIKGCIDGNGLSFAFEVDGVFVSDVNAIIANMKDELDNKIDWVRRFKRFADKYLKGDLIETGRCLKHVSIFHQWNQLQNITEIDWHNVEWESTLSDAGGEVAAACSGGKCEI